MRLGPTNAEIVSVSGRGLASVAEITGTCGSLESASQVSLGTTNLRILGREIALPANPEPNTEVALSDIPGLVSGTVILNEQATFGDGATSKIVAVAPLRLLLRLSLAGLGGLADVEVSLAGNSAAVDCAPDGEPPTDDGADQPKRRDTSGAANDAAHDSTDDSDDSNDADDSNHAVDAIDANDAVSSVDTVDIRRLRRRRPRPQTPGHRRCSWRYCFRIALAARNHGRSRRLR